MPRRTGKATSRKAHQRPPKRPLQHVVLPPPGLSPPAAQSAAASAPVVPPVGTPDAREAISLNPPRRVVPSFGAAADSTLTTRERAEYHYVERDLRNIGILTALMVLGLVIAWVIFSQLGL
ncbi:MAG: hypothetical protein ACR2F5_01215, partial [Candidatus Limnocylindria bacterium]